MSALDGPYLNLVTVPVWRVHTAVMLARAQPAGVDATASCPHGIISCVRTVDLTGREPKHHAMHGARAARARGFS